MEKKLLWEGTMKDVIDMAEWLHERYEKSAKFNDWETNKSCQVEFDDLPEENKKTMMDVAKDILIKIEEEKQKILKLHLKQIEGA